MNKSRGCYAQCQNMSQEQFDAIFPKQSSPEGKVAFEDNQVATQEQIEESLSQQFPVMQGSTEQ